MSNSLERSSTITAAVMAVLTFSAPTETLAQTSLAQALSSQYAQRLREVCELFEPKGPGISVSTKDIPQAFSILTRGDQQTIPPSDSADPEMAIRQVKAHLEMFGYHNFSAPVLQFQTDLGLQANGIVGEQTRWAAEKVAEAVIACATINELHFLATQRIEKEIALNVNIQAQLSALQNRLNHIQDFLTAEGSTPSTLSFSERIAFLIAERNLLRVMVTQISTTLDKLQTENQTYETYLIQAEKAVQYLLNTIQTLERELKAAKGEPVIYN